MPALFPGALGHRYRINQEYKARIEGVCTRLRDRRPKNVSRLSLDNVIRSRLSWIVDEVVVNMISNPCEETIALFLAVREVRARWVPLVDHDKPRLDFLASLAMLLDDGCGSSLPIEKLKEIEQSSETRPYFYYAKYWLAVAYHVNAALDRLLYDEAVDRYVQMLDGTVNKSLIHRLPHAALLKEPITRVASKILMPIGEPIDQLEVLISEGR